MRDFTHGAQELDGFFCWFVFVLFLQLKGINRPP